MEAVHTPLILYIPGLLPKPKPDAHHDALFRCLEAGVRQIDADIADDIVETPHSFDLVSSGNTPTKHKDNTRSVSS